MKLRRRPKAPPPPNGTVIAEVVEGSRTIQRVWYGGRDTCLCPFACLATSERCAFECVEPPPSDNEPTQNQPSGKAGADDE